MDKFSWMAFYSAPYIINIIMDTISTRLYSIYSCTKLARGTFYPGQVKSDTEMESPTQYFSVFMLIILSSVNHTPNCRQFDSMPVGVLIFGVIPLTMTFV